VKNQSLLYLALTIPLMLSAGNGRAENTTPVPSGYTWGHGDYHSGTWQPPANNPQQTQPQQPQGPSQDEIARQQQAAADAAERKRQEEAAKAAAQAEFDAAKLNALNSLKGISSGDLQLKTIGSDNPSLGLKGLDNSSAFSQLKGGSFDSPTKHDFPVNELRDLNPVAAKPVSAQPFIITDAMVVDARDVPTGLPKSVEDTIPPTPAGDRVRKGFEAVSSVDW
jgi:hypothetical protein